MFPFSHLQSSTLLTYLHQTNDTASYALVTGATDGIGLAFAQELLSAGFNVLLHGRNPTKLARVQSELSKSYPLMQIHTLVADASNCTQSTIDGLITQVRSIPDLSLTVLINNVGGTGVLKANFQTFAGHTPEEILAVTNLNITFTVQLTHALLPLFKSHSFPSLVMNISSIAQFGMPYLPVYSGAKAFLHAWSHSLATEYAPFANNEPIEVLEVIVGSVQTQQNQTERPTLFVPEARTIAGAALARVGCGERNGVVAYWPHALQEMFVRLAPGWVSERMFVSQLRAVVGKEERVW